MVAQFFMIDTRVGGYSLGGVPVALGTSETEVRLIISKTSGPWDAFRFSLYASMRIGNRESFGSKSSGSDRSLCALSYRFLLYCGVRLGSLC
jgi:hypothetical protein